MASAISILPKRSHRLVSLFAVLLLVTASCISLGITNQRVGAETNTYPWDDATDANPANYDWGYVTCPSNASNCRERVVANKGTRDPRHYDFRNCTSYVAFKMNQQLGIDVSGWGNAADFDENAVAAGYTKSGTPQVGDIVQWDTPAPYGHVAYVYAVASGVASISEYNHDTEGHFGTNRTVTANAGGVDFIHMGTPASGGGVYSSYRNDFDGDRKTDLLFLHKLSASNSANMYIYNQANSFASPGLIRDFLATSGWNWNEIKLESDDVNGDGITDLGMLHKTSDDGANFYVFYGGTGQFANTSPINFPGGSGFSWNDMKLQMGDYDGDGKADFMVIHKMSNGGANIYVYYQSQGLAAPGYVQSLPGTSGWSWNDMKFSVGDVNYDGKADLLMMHKRTDNGANFYVLYGGISNFAGGLPAREFAGTSGWVWNDMKLRAGDFDVDNRADLLMLHKLSDNMSAHLYIFNQSAGFANWGYVRDYPASVGWGWNKMKLSTGDVNGDGYDDMTMLHKSSDSGANFYAFYGGTGQFANTSPAAQFYGTNGWAWDSMLLPKYVQ